LAGRFLGLGDTVLVLLRILELERVDGFDVDTQLSRAVRVEELAEPRARADPHVVRALRTDVAAALDLGAVQHRAARRALEPQPFGDLLFRGAAVRLDARRNEFLEPVHAGSDDTAPPGSP